MWKPFSGSDDFLGNSTQNILEDTVGGKSKEVGVAKGNPNPRRFQITRIETIGRFVIMKVNYPDCTNYEGDKILVYENASVSSLTSQNSIDPHFFECTEKPSPIARFKPTMLGWAYAVNFCKFS